MTTPRPAPGRRDALRLAGAAGAAGLLAACTGRSPAPSATSSRGAPRVEIVSRVRTDRLDTLTLHTDAVPDDVRVNILRPASYARGSTRYPVLYLLHGSNGSADSWLGTGRVRRLVDARDVIVVMPDGGAQGWYLDWAQADPVTHWESLHVRGLVPLVDREYRTHATRAGRAVAGFSMGGFGAVHYAQAHPDVFGAVSSYSGAVSLRRPTDFAALDGQAIDGKPAHAIFGDDAAAAAAAVAAVDPPDHADRLRRTRVRLFCGDAPDGQEAQMRGAGEVLAKALAQAGIPGGLSVRRGAHEPATWESALAEDLPGLLGALTPMR